MLDESLTAFVFASLPPPPARVLEVGAGQGELAEELRSRGYDVVAIDPASETASVRPVALHELDEPDGSFGAALAVLSMHHVEPLPESCERLAELLSSGGRLVLDELDVDRFDRRAARWWLEQQAVAGERGEHETHHDEHHDRPSTPEELLDFLHQHCHRLSLVSSALEPWFALEEPVRGPYLYRWYLPPELRAVEEGLIAAQELPATGARLLGVRR